MPEKIISKPTNKKYREGWDRAFNESVIYFSGVPVFVNESAPIDEITFETEEIKSLLFREA